MAQSACPSVSLCVGAGPDIFTSTDPTGGASAWATTVLPGTGWFSDVSCPSSTLCVAPREDGSVATSTDPTGGARAWSVGQIDPGHALDAVFCSALPECFITNSASKVFCDRRLRPHPRYRVAATMQAAS